MLAFVNMEYKFLIVVMFLLSVMTVMFSKKIEKKRKEKKSWIINAALNLI